MTFVKKTRLTKYNSINIIRILHVTTLKIYSTSKIENIHHNFCKP